MNQEVLRYADWYWWPYGVNVHELLGEGKNEPRQHEEDNLKSYS